MRCASFFSHPGFLLLPALFFLPVLSGAGDDFSFDIEEIGKKSFAWGGYAEFKWEHMDISQGSALSLLNLVDDPATNIDRFSGSLQLDGRYSRNMLSFKWLLKGAGRQDNFGWTDFADVYEAYGSIKPSTRVNGSLGKKSYSWGKGYAWNPVGFINRLKDPNNPDESREGYITAETDLIKSYGGRLQTTALTAVLLPVQDGINEDFGEPDHLNLAAKLYVLFLDADIDLLLLAGGSRSTSYGLDFSKNLASNFEIHGELALSTDKAKLTLQQDDTLLLSREKAFSWLVGLRYLSALNTTSIIEYYHNGGGYSEEEMNRFYYFVREAGEHFQQSAGRFLLDQARDISLKGYGRPYPGRNYLYARISQKEPFNFLYFTPALTAIINIDDESYTLTPELEYDGFTNWEIRLRCSYLNGGSLSEYGEKQNSNKVELRLRYFF